jgi:capsule biosynthesis phosphatase
MTVIPSCCTRGSYLIHYDQDSFYLWGDDGKVDVNFCPFCGQGLVLPGYVKKGIKTICVDVDGVVSNDEDPNLHYNDRPPYPVAVEAVRRLKREGFEILFQTARGMGRYGNDQRRAEAEGRLDLIRWLDKHEIPYDGVFFGKVHAGVFVDDKGFRVDTSEGPQAWEAFFDFLGLENRTPLASSEDDIDDNKESSR